jgi:hypothetical protein
MEKQNFCSVTDCLKVELSEEYLFDCGDRFIISYIQEGKELDLSSAKRRYLLVMILCGIVLIVVSLVICNFSFHIMGLWYLSIIWLLPFFLIFLYYLFCISPITEIQKDKILNIYYKNWPNCIIIKFKNGWFVKKRLIFITSKKEQRDKILQCLRDNKILK